MQLLGKPISECHALCVQTAQWGNPMSGPAVAVLTGLAFLGPFFGWPLGLPPERGTAVQLGLVLAAGCLVLTKLNTARRDVRAALPDVSRPT
ncbi:hypothetical protein SAMN04488564_101176 [Lentzea waywayandensis]|uniref:Uncharacterized protein n=1 Tax=Lentzea waywayandensis TaxID=84724 RepID=A0A1I6CS50_9PSEU|nr:hypothetical protein [Lentzea waywayandensis]SFQ95947.1 hypothetical protein SAMN04488564_101176 [Lentzea waywayandensis]